MYVIMLSDILEVVKVLDDFIEEYGCNTYY